MRDTNACEIPAEHDLHAVAADAVSHSPPADGTHDQQSFPLLEKLRRCALPAGAELSGLSVLLAALGKNAVRRCAARARRRRAAGQAALDRLQQRIRRPAAVLIFPPP